MRKYLQRAARGRRSTQTLGMLRAGVQSVTFRTKPPLLKSRLRKRTIDHADTPWPGRRQAYSTTATTPTPGHPGEQLAHRASWQMPAPPDPCGEAGCAATCKPLAGTMNEHCHGRGRQPAKGTQLTGASATEKKAQVTEGRWAACPPWVRNGATKRMGERMLEASRTQPQTPADRRQTERGPTRAPHNERITGLSPKGPVATSPRKHCEAGPNAAETQHQPSPPLGGHFWPPTRTFFRPRFRLLSTSKNIALA